jgi:hypothetical protein
MLTFEYLPRTRPRFSRNLCVRLFIVLASIIALPLIVYCGIVAYEGLELSHWKKRCMQYEVSTNQIAYSESRDYGSINAVRLNKQTIIQAQGPSCWRKYLSCLAKRPSNLIPPVGFLDAPIFLHRLSMENERSALVYLSIPKRVG